MLRTIRILGACGTALLAANGVYARGGGGGYIVTITPAAQPGNGCIAEGVSSGQETRNAGGVAVLVQGVHGANTKLCTNPAFPNWASLQKLPSEEARSKPSQQCVPIGTQVGQEIVLYQMGRVKVLEVQDNPDQCGGPGQAASKLATVISAAAARAASSSPAAEASASAPAAAAPAEPSEAQLLEEYERRLAAVPAVEEYRVRHILVRTQEIATTALARLRAGEQFAAVAADLSIDSQSRVKGGDLGWNVPKYFAEDFSNAMVALKPAGLSAEPVRTHFGWHVIEVVQTKMGKDSYPSFSEARERIAASMRHSNANQEVANVAAVCRKRVSPVKPAAAVKEGASGTVVAHLRIEKGRVSHVVSLSGPSVFHAAVTEAVLKYECDTMDRPVIATQSFEFKAGE